MKKIFILFLVNLFFSIGFSQMGVLSTTKLNKLYYYIQNPVKVVYQDIPCDKLFLESIDCNIEKKDCEFIILPKKIGSIQLIVKNDSSTIDTITIRSIHPPLTELNVGHGGYRFNNPDLSEFGYTFKVDSVSIKAYRNDSLLFDKDTDVSFYIDIQKLKKNDIYMIYRIKIRRIDPQGKEFIYWEDKDYVFKKYD
ncbi:MAG: hypothetical protein IPF63_15885 [Bacteroidetes bacterium]|nr:hypothetical protein [Bacteroidota bacterium]MBL0080601.1 hypothetical protein [Bacteroidota bacterium]